MGNYVTDPVRASFAPPLALPAAMRARPQWVAWRRDARTAKDGALTTTKVLYDAKVYVTARRARTNDPSTWASFDDAVTFLQEYPYDFGGVGYVIHRDDPIVGVDIDHCFDADGKLRPDVLAMILAAGSFAEISQSGKGVHIFVRGSVAHLIYRYGQVIHYRPGNPMHDKYPQGNDLHYGRRHASGIEIYGGKRFIACTGDQIDGTSADAVENQPWIDAFYRDLFGADSPVRPRTAARMTLTLRPTTDRREPSWASQGPFNDIPNQRLIEIALSKDPKFAALWHDRPVNNKRGDAMGPSEKRMALAPLLGWWCGPDEPRIMSIIAESRLYANYPDPDKFDRDLDDNILPMMIPDRIEDGTWFGQPDRPAPPEVAQPAGLVFGSKTSAGLRWQQKPVRTPFGGRK